MNQFMDFGAARALDPEASAAYVNRGNTYFSTRQFVLAALALVAFSGESCWVTDSSSSRSLEPSQSKPTQLSRIPAPPLTVRSSRSTL
jgi:hypothetical protein